MVPYTHTILYKARLFKLNHTKPNQTEPYQIKLWRDAVPINNKLNNLNSKSSPNTLKL